jgi:hypothetical protein
MESSWFEITYVTKQATNFASQIFEPIIRNIVKNIIKTNQPIKHTTRLQRNELFFIRKFSQTFVIIENLLVKLIYWTEALIICKLFLLKHWNPLKALWHESAMVLSTQPVTAGLTSSVRPCDNWVTRLSIW